MQLLSIFNNGSQAWILFVMMLIWAAVFGTKTYLGYKKGDTKQLPNGQYVDLPRTLKNNANFWLLILGEIGLLVFLLWINSEYAK